MADTGDTWLTQIDENEPDGAVRVVAVLDDHQRRMRAATKNTIDQEHDLGSGRHKDVINLGNDLATSKEIVARVLAANKPKIVYSVANSRWEATDDGINLSRMVVFRSSGETVKAVFAQPAAPTFWTQDAAYADRVLVFNGGAGDGTFGSINPNNGVATVDVGGEHNHGAATGATAISTPQMPIHAHTQSHDNVVRAGDIAIQGSGQFETHTPSTGNAGSGSTHDHSISGSGTHAHNYNYDFSGRYVIACFYD